MSASEEAVMPDDFAKMADLHDKGKMGDEKREELRNKYFKETFEATTR